MNTSIEYNHIQRSVDRILTKVQESGLFVALTYEVSGKFLGNYKIKTIFQNSLLLSPQCELQQEIYIPNPMQESVDVYYSVTQDGVKFQILEDSDFCLQSGIKPPVPAKIAVFTLFFSIEQLEVLFK